MTVIEVEDGLQVRFPGRGPEFLEGVEIGLLLAELATGASDVRRRFRLSAVDQAHELAAGFGYRAEKVDHGAGWVDLNFTRRRSRPRLSVVSG